MQRNLMTFLILSAATMSLGWGLRGTIGGGPFGAMIPGAMIGLCLCLLLDLKKHVHLIAAMGAVGIGIGGQMTYGQTIGFAKVPETMWWGLLGLTLKGAAWGVVGGAILGMGFMIQKYTRKEVLLSLLYLAVGTMVGWAIFDHTKLIYFSDRHNKPREEVLMGMFLGAVGFLIIPWMKKREKFTLEMGLWGLLFGGLGFGGGGLFMAISERVPAAYQKLPYWKGMEFTFGALLGIGYAIACYRNREMLKRENLALSEQDDVWGKLPRAATYPVLLLLVVASLWFNFGLSQRPWTPSEGIYTILGCLLLAVAICSEFLAAHIAFSVTVVAFFRDFIAGALKMKGSEAIQIPPRSLWGITFILAMPVVAYVSTQLQAKTKRTARELLLLTWAGVIDCFAKFFFLLNGLDHGLVEKVFVIETLIVTGMVLAISSRDVEEA